MVKNKKMSKTSIAVIVLALLLVFSLVMGMTGAWFTDTKTPTAQQQTITFGKIDVDAGLTAIAAGNWSHALPGDTAALAGTATVKAGSEDLYILVKAESSILDDQDSPIALYYDSAHQHPALTVTFADGTNAAFQAVSAYAGEGNLYYVAGTALDKVLNLAGTVTFDSHTGNIAYDGSGTEVRVNVADQSYTVHISVTVSAVQARNLVTTPGASITGTDLTAVTDALAAAVAAE